MSGNDNVGDTLREMWESRPARLRQDRKLAGVSAAIGRRYGIDPVLVRVAFAVATIPGGGGLALYLALWVLLPSDPDAPSRNRFGRLVGVALVVLIGVPTALSMLYPHGWLVFGAACAGLYLLHRGYRDRQVAVLSTPGQAAPSAPGQAVASAPAAPVGENTWVYPGAQQRAEPPSWDPLGAAPFAWDLPEPGVEPEPPQPKRTWITWVALAVAVLAGGAALTAGGSAGSALAVVLGVLGVGMLCAAFLRGGRALIAFALPVGALALLLGPGAGDDAEPAPPQDRRVVATTTAGLRESYPYLERGTLTLDLRQLRLAGDEQVETGAHVGQGRVRVLLPRDLDVTAGCTAERGAVHCLGTQENGGEHTRLDIDDPGADGPGGGHLTVEAFVSDGMVEVLRG
ncbi:PspC domain-containing protein [Saccharopolyspora gregorii]